MEVLLQKISAIAKVNSEIIERVESKEFKRNVTGYKIEKDNVSNNYFVKEEIQDVNSAPKFPRHDNCVFSPSSRPDLFLCFL
jgi:hypothetical protein